MLSEIAKIIGLFPNSLLAIIITNIILIFGFIFGKLLLYRFENRVKFLSLFTVFISVTMVAYFISIIWFSLSNLYNGNAVYAAMFPIFLFLPFIFGHFASYEKIQYYTNVQVLTLVISLLLAFSFI